MGFCRKAGEKFGSYSKKVARKNKSSPTIPVWLAETVLDFKLLQIKPGNKSTDLVSKLCYYKECKYRLFAGFY